VNQAQADPPITKTLKVILIALVTLLLFLTALRATLTPGYLRLAYSVPGFPEDGYGFTAEQRLHHAEIARQYLLNDEAIDFLGDQTFEDGSPLYIERELRHMEDVKELTQVVLKVWLGLLFLSPLAALAFYMQAGMAQLGTALRQAGNTTLIAMVALGLTLAVSFSFVFVGFHRIFFEGDTWLFRFSDTLIRLFPERFWQQVFVFLALVAGVLAAAVRWLGARLSRQPEAS
jgi:integral membrane protein (TIGR01906 family)